MKDLSSGIVLGKREAPQDPPKIEFPCEDYPIKIMGDSGERYYQQVIEIVKVHAPGLDLSSVTVKDSRNGTFQSITVKIVATGIAQLKAMHEDLKSVDGTKMVL